MGKESRIEVCAYLLLCIISIKRSWSSAGCEKDWTWHLFPVLLLPFPPALFMTSECRNSQVLCQSERHSICPASPLSWQPRREVEGMCSVNRVSRNKLNGPIRLTMWICLFAFVFFFIILMWRSSWLDNFQTQIKALFFLLCIVTV